MIHHIHNEEVILSSLLSWQSTIVGDDKKELAFGEIGEIAIKGDAIIPGILVIVSFSIVGYSTSMYLSPSICRLLGKTRRNPEGYCKWNPLYWRYWIKR